MILEYLNKAGKYIYGNRVLMIICTLIVFIVTANLLKFISNIHDEHFGNCKKKETFTNNNNNNKNNNKNNKLEGFMDAQMRNMNNNQK